MAALHASLASALRELGVGRAERLLVAVSGGADSVALLHLLLAVGQHVAVGHVHHGLRDEADRDAAFVRDLARRSGVPFGERRVDARTRDGRSPEARARMLRYGALLELAGELGCGRIATAHTLEDQAETVLLRAIRGTGLDGLGGIEPESGNRRVIRPLLQERRAALRSYLEERGLNWRQDRSNEDLRIPRNRLRASVLPVLEEVHPGATRKLAQLSEFARISRDEDRAQVRSALARAVAPGGGGLWIDAEALRELAPSARRRAILALLARAGLSERVTRHHVNRVAHFLGHARRGSALSLPADSTLVRRGERFWLGPAAGPEPAQAAHDSLPMSERAGRSGPAREQGGPPVRPTGE